MFIALEPKVNALNLIFTKCGGRAITQHPQQKLSDIMLSHRENTTREESKYLECDNRQLGLRAIATNIFKPPSDKFKIGR